MTAELFHEATAVLGGRLDPASLSPQIAAHFAGYRGVAESCIAALCSGHKMPPIHFDFIASDDVNAYAFSYKGKRFVGVTTGTTLGIMLLFWRMLSDRRILAYIGDPQKETEQSPLTEPLIPAILQSARQKAVSCPHDALRSEYCTLLSEMAFTVLIFHELTHHRNGHVDYLAARGAPFLAELGYAPANRDESIMRQAIETDADAGAAMFTLEIMNRQWLNRYIRASSELKDDKAVLHALAIAVFSFWRVFADAPLAAANLEKRTHPPVSFRTGFFMDAILQLGKATYQIPEENIFDGINRAIALSEEGFRCLTGKCSTDIRARYADFFDPVGREYVMRLKKCWEAGLRKELEAHAYGPPVIYQ